MWWQILLVLAAWIACSLLFSMVWALGHRDRPPHKHPCKCCGAYGQKPAHVQAPVPVRVISPVPKAPLKGIGPDELRAGIIRDIEIAFRDRR